MIDRIGPLDEQFFMYCEDEDWCWRARQAGGVVVYDPEITVFHVKGASSRKARVRMAFHWHRSLWLFHRKNLSPKYHPIANGAVYAGIAVSMLCRVTLAWVQERVARPGTTRLSAP
jgi:GT2 family glycosyltransferase